MLPKDDYSPEDDSEINDWLDKIAYPDFDPDYDELELMEEEYE